MAEDWEALAAAVQAARPPLRLDSFVALLEATGISDRTMRRLLMKRLPVREDTLRKLERGLGWAPHSADQILAGGGPTPSTLVAVVPTAKGTTEIHQPSGPPDHYWRLAPDARAAVDAVILQLPAAEHPET